MRRRILSVILIFVLCLNMLPAGAMAAEQDDRNVCTHHPEHTDECGYMEAVPETPCSHVHTEDCWHEEVHCVYEDTAQADSNAESAEDISSAAAHVCSEATGCVTKILDCQHQHDETCGYAPAVPGRPCEFVCPVCSQAENTQTAPYYLLLIHTLAYHDTQYGFSEVICLSEEDLQGGYDLRQHVLEKDGMEAAEISCFNPETGDLEEVRTLSPDIFAEGGDPEDGSGYLAAQVLIEYEVLDGYRPVLQGDSAQVEDPYGVMPLTSFEGGNIKDITFVSADVLTVRIQYKYSPTGGLAGMDAADSQVFQIKVDNVERDADGNITSAPEFNKTWDLPHYDGTSYPTLEGFRIVLNPAPLNEFLNDPDLAEQAMKGELTADKIQQALKDDSFSVKTDNITDPNKYVYQWQVEKKDPPATYENYPINGNYNNRYSDVYNDAWDNARSIESTETSGYTARAVQKVAAGNQGANPLTDPQLTLTLTKDQCQKALESAKDLTVTVYYRRNAGFYHVGHWVTRTSLSADDISTYTKKYSDYNKKGVGPFDQNYLMVCLERKQGRVGALTNACANPREAEGILSSFNPRAVNQKIIDANTRVDIIYDTADRYGLIFQTEDSYIPRQYVNKGYKVTFTTGSGAGSGMQVTDNSNTPVSGYVDYKNPTRQGYTFAGWKYQVRSDVTGGVIEENGRKYKTVAADTQWEITETMVDEAVVIRDSDSGDAKMIYLYPVWTPDMANVRVVYWTEDLGGGANDVDVNVDSTPGGADYRSRVSDYLNGTPDTVGARFSNVGSFTFMAPTNSTLDLSMSSGKFATNVTDSFTTTGESVDKTGTENKTGTLNKLIDDMFPVRMPDVPTSTDPIDTSKFYHPYQVEGKKTGTVEYTVAPDGSTVINIYYARNVYTLDFTYYGEIKEENGCLSGVHYDGSDGLVVATNTTGYSKGPVGDGFKYNYQNNGTKNRWQRVDVTTEPQWTVPQTLTISAKYDADLREVWPLSGGESIQLTLDPNDDPDGTKGWRDTAIFMSWGTTAGPFNQTYRDGNSNESTIIGNYRSMSADIIADPDTPATIHHLVGYWWNMVLTNYRRNACYEVPGLTKKVLLDAADTLTYDLKNRAIVYDFTSFPESNRIGANPLYGLIAEPWRELGNGIFQKNISEDEANRRDTLYLVPVKGTLEEYFKDYDSNFIRVDKNGEPDKDGGFYAVRWIDAGAGNPEVYALGRQASSVSTNNILNQAPTAIPNMESVSFTYVCEGKETDPPVSVDHDTRAWDNWGRTAESSSVIGWQGYVGLGSAENPYDLWFYYKRARFEIIYMVASRNSTSGEYEIGRHETIYGQNMAHYNLKLPAKAARMYSNDLEFKDYWTAADNSKLAMPESSSPANGLKDGYTRLCPDSAVDGTGEWSCKYWTLDRSGSGVMRDADWNRMVTGNLRVFAQWMPPEYRVKFDFDGGSYNGSGKFDIQTVKANVGYTSSGNSIPSPTKDGYVFNGWTWYEGKPVGTDDLAAGTLRSDFTFEKPITRDMVLKANWVPSARMSYNYKIWYLTDDENAGSVTLPKVEGEWLTGSRGTPQPDSQHQDYTHVLGCQYVGNKTFPEDTILSLAAVTIPGYAPVKISTTLTLDKDKNGTGAEDTGNVAYFYYRKRQVKSYTVRFQLWDKTGEEGILKGFTVHRDIADSTYFTPGDKTWRNLKNAGYYLVLMNKDGEVGEEQLKDGEPIAAKSYTDLSDFINKQSSDFANYKKGGEDFLVTFKVAPYHYNIQYRVGTVTRNGTVIIPSDTLAQNMQAALDRLCGEAVKAAIAAGKNPTQYVVANFDNGYSFTLKNPAAVQDLDDPSKEWRFTGWSPAPETKVLSLSRSVNGEYPTLEIERSEGDLEFLANWELVEKNTPSVDQENPSAKPSDSNTPVDAASPYYVNAAKTGENGVFPWVLLSIMSFSGIAAICLTGLFRNRNKRNRF